VINRIPYTATLKEERYEIRFSGSGGQGIIMAALIFAEAVGVYDGKYVCQSQSYGPEARGGVSQAEVVISAQPIDYPRAIKLDLLLAMNQISCDTHFRDLKPEGLLVVDSSLVEQTPTGRVIALPFTRLARQVAGRATVRKHGSFRSCRLSLPGGLIKKPGKGSAFQNTERNRNNEP
jgi:2-oxoglutarate ferredoxin oxidoreductase subunit gamma